MTWGEWVLLCAAEDLPVGTARRFDHVAEAPIALYHAESGFYATDDTCTHAQASLSEGDLEGDLVVCPVHWACFDLRTGKAMEFPATVDLRTYPVRVTGGQVEVCVAARVRSDGAL